MTPSEIPCLPVVFGPQNEENCQVKLAHKYCVFIMMARLVSDNAPNVLACQLPVTRSRLLR